MNTLIEVSAEADLSTVVLEDSVEESLSKFDYVVKKFSRFDPHSELSKLNRSSGMAFEASEELFRLVSFALKASRETGGMYDPTIIDLLSAFGYDRSYDESRILNRLNQEGLAEQIKHIRSKRPSPLEIYLNQRSKTIKLMPKQRIDLGSVAKGYAIDLAASVLVKSGVERFLINAGGDVYSKGGYKIALFDPRTSEGKVFETIDIDSQAIAGSGSFARRVGVFSHIIFPKAKNYEPPVQTYVIAPTATEADLYATVLFLLGRKGLPLVESRGYRGFVLSSFD